MQLSTTVLIISAYSPKKRLRTTFSTKGRTKQAFKAECDINNILSRFLRTGVMDFANKNQARYGDCTGVEYQAAMCTVAAAKSMFNDLPAHIRNRFENEPAQFLDFVQDEKNREEAAALGLLKPEAARKPDPGTSSPSQADGADKPFVGSRKGPVQGDATANIPQGARGRKPPTPQADGGSDQSST